MRRTKIVCTIGPATSSAEAMAELIRAGMDVARINFSHGDHGTHRGVIERLRKVSAELGEPVAILQDLCGPKMRVGEMAPDVVLRDGDRFVLTTADVVGDGTRASVSYDGIVRDVKAGDRVLLDDGLLELVVEEVHAEDVRCRVVTGGALSSRKGVNFPGVALSIPSVTEKDFADLELGLDLGVDFVALSFVRRPEDVAQVKERVRARGLDTPVIVKIEKFEALERLEAILQAADGAMVARGDLGVETAFERVPLEQKRIIRLCRRYAKPVITATQMLDSMIRNPRPTRAEATDVANAVLDGTDAVMLSGETAVGKYPFDAVRTMARIAVAAEEAMPYAEVVDVDPFEPSAANSLSLVACELAERLRAAVIIACTTSGETARRIAQFRPRAPVLAITQTERLVRRLQLFWGVVPRLVPAAHDTDQVLDYARQAALDTGLGRPGSIAVIQAGVPAGVPGSTNMIKLDVLGYSFHRGDPAGPARRVRGTVVQRVDGELDGRVLVVPSLSASHAGVLQRLAGVVTAEGGAGTDAARMLLEAGVPGVLGVAGALEVLPEGARVTLDVERGLVYQEGGVPEDEG